MERTQIELRDYQLAAVDDVLNSFRNKINCVVQLPTGTGKTTVIAEAVKRLVKNNPKFSVLIVVHRIELLDQVSTRLFQFGIANGKIKSGPTVESDLRVQVGLIQSLKNNNKKPNNPDIIIVDEAHHIAANSYVSLIEYYNDNKPVIIGFTATPSRLDGRCISKIFTEVLEYGQISDFVKQGFLSPMKHFATGEPELDKIRVLRTGDYDQAQLQREMSRELVMAELIKGYKAHAAGKKMIVFAVNTLHAELIANRYTENGYPAVSVDYKTDSLERKKIIEDFRNGEIQILCNVNLFTEGFDCPDVEVIQLARPTKSLNSYLQMIGRGMRIFPGKEYGLILDNANLWKEHGLSTRTRHWKSSGIQKLFVNYNTQTKVIGQIRLPQESDILDLKEVIETAIEIDLHAWTWHFPIPINDFIKRCLRIAEFGNSGLSINLNVSYDHFITGEVFTFRELLNSFNFDINRGEKTISYKRVTEGFDLFFSQFNPIESKQLIEKHNALCTVANWYRTLQTYDYQQDQKLGRSYIDELNSFHEKGFFEDFEMEGMPLVFPILELNFGSLVNLFQIIESHYHNKLSVITSGNNTTI